MLGLNGLTQHICFKIQTGPFYYLLMCLNVDGFIVPDKVNFSDVLIQMNTKPSLKEKTTFVDL